MKHTSSYYYVESLVEKSIKTIGHSADEETGEIYYKFLDRKKANNLLRDEKKLVPEFKYRVVKVTTTHNAEQWQ